jgi:hypothetical protein
VSNSCGIYEDIKRFLTGIMQKLKFFHIWSTLLGTYDPQLCHRPVDQLSTNKQKPSAEKDRPCLRKIQNDLHQHF